VVDKPARAVGRGGQLGVVARHGALI
jgi:hypothetical protein